MEDIKTHEITTDYGMPKLTVLQEKNVEVMMSQNRCPKNFFEYDVANQEIIFHLLKKDKEALKNNQVYKFADQDVFIYYLQSINDFG